MNMITVELLIAAFVAQKDYKKLNYGNEHVSVNR